MASRCSIHLMDQGMLDYIISVKRLNKNLHDLVVNQKTRLE
jgi:hypothetical protein